MKKRKVRVPKSVDVIRLRKNTFIGDTEFPNHLVHEVLDNSFDEIRNGYGNAVNLHFNEDGSVWMMDSGRGLPQGTVIIEETGNEKDSIEALFTELHSGSKFSLEDDVDVKSLFGQNGVGLTAINALSEWVEVYTKKGNTQTLYYKFEDSNLIKKQLIDTKSKWSTIIGFKPSKNYFNYIKYNIEIFKQRLQLVKAKINKSNFYLNNEKIKSSSLKKFSRKILELDSTIPIYKMSCSNEHGDIIIYLTYADKKSLCLGDANFRICGGKYITALQTLIKKILPTKLNKNYAKVSERYLIDGLQFYISLVIPEPKFDSQEKTRLINDIKKKLIEPLSVQLGKILAEEHIQTTIKAIIDRKANKSFGKKFNTTGRVSHDNKLVDCINTPGRILYIVEGDSAGTNLQNVRDKYWEAYLPLKGKIINVEKKPIDQIMKNKEVNDLKEAIGPKNSRRYEFVKLLSDSDPDGGHITVLNTLILQKYFTDMIREGRVFVIFPPIYGASKGKKYIPLYNINDTVKYKKQGYVIRHFKGLGEMNPNHFKSLLKSDMEYRITLPKSKQAISDIISIVTNTEKAINNMNDMEQTLTSFLDITLKQKGK